MTGQVAFLTQLLALTLLRLRCVLRSGGSRMLGSERVSGIRQQDTGHGLGQAGCSHQAGARVKSQHFRTELPWPARSTEISAQRRERGAGQLRLTPAPSVIIVKVVCSLRLRSHTQDRARAEPQPVPEPEPWHHNRSPLILTVTYKPPRGEEQWVHSIESDS